MARTNQIHHYKLDFDSVIRGHHISKDIWTPTNGEALKCYPDDDPEALNHDENAIAVMKDDKVVGHIPGKNMSKLMKHFLSQPSSRLIAVPNGKRKFEKGLVVPCRYIASLPIKNRNAEKNMKTLKKYLEDISNDFNENVDIIVHSIERVIDSLI